MEKQDTEILKIIKNFSEKLPHFPDGRINYSNSDTAPVLTCFLKYKNKILLLKRSDKVRTYQGKWNTVAGYLDEPKSIREKALEEIQEELGIKENNILLINIGKYYKFTDNEIEKHKTWITCPVLAELKNEPEIRLDREHTRYKWISPKELTNFDIVPKLDESLKRVLENKIKVKL